MNNLHMNIFKFRRLPRHCLFLVTSKARVITCKISNNFLSDDIINVCKGAQSLSGRVLDSRPRGRGFEPHRRHCVVVLKRHIYPSYVLVQPRKIRLCLTENLLIGRKVSNQTNKRLYSSQQRVGIDTIKYFF